MTDATSGEADHRPFGILDAEGLLWALVSATSDSVILVDLDGRVIRWNPASERLYGWSHSEVLGEVLPHVPEKIRLRAITDVRALAASGSIVERETEAVRKDGTRVVVDLVTIPVLDDEGDPAGLLAIGRGVSSDERLEGQRAAFVDLIGRRLTEPLASLASGAGLLLRPEIGGDQGRRSSIANSVARAAESSAHFLETLVIASGIEAGRLMPTMEPTDIAQVVTDLTSRHGGRRTLVDFDPSLPPIQSDRRLLTHAVGVLFDVAERVTPAAERPSASVHASKGGVLLEVCDRGPELDAQEAARLTEAPYTGDDVRGEQGGAMGIGYVAAIARVLQARLTIAPVTPHGARYTISFDSTGSRKDTKLP